MMRLKVTHLKAPWPQGVSVGDVVELPAVPDWAVGKCHITDEAVTVFAMEHDSGGSPVVANVVPDSIAEAEAQAAYERSAIEAAAKKPRKGKA